MKNKTKIFLALITIIFALFAFGCAKQKFVCSDGTTVNDAALCKIEPKEEPKPETQPQVETETELPKEEPKPAQPAEPAIPEYKLEEDDIFALNKKLATTDIAFLRDSNPQGIKIGESIVYPLGIRNTFNQEREYSVELTFVEILPDVVPELEGDGDDRMLTWIKYNQLEPIKIAKGKNGHYAIGVTPTDTIDARNHKTVKGLYKFRADVFSVNPYGSKKIIKSLFFNVRVNT